MLMERKESRQTGLDVDVDEEIARAASRSRGTGADPDEARIHEPPGERDERALGLQPSQWRIVVWVDAAAEAEALVVPAVGVESLGIMETGRVPTAGSEQGGHRWAS